MFLCKRLQCLSTRTAFSCSFYKLVLQLKNTFFYAPYKFIDPDHWNDIMYIVYYKFIIEHNFGIQRISALFLIFVEVVCLILGPILTSCVSTILTLFTYFLGFNVPSSLTFIENNFFIILVSMYIIMIYTYIIIYIIYIETIMRFIQHYGQFLCVYQFYRNHFLSLTIFFVSLTTFYTVPKVSLCQSLSIQSNDYNYYNSLV